MRNIKELLQLMMDNQRLLKSGLCELALILYLRGVISGGEKNFIYDYISAHPPTNVITVGKQVWFWNKGDIEPRIDWLNTHIKLNS